MKPKAHALIDNGFDGAVARTRGILIKSLTQSVVSTAITATEFRVGPSNVSTFFFLLGLLLPRQMEHTLRNFIFNHVT